jgi:hypothetical protein
MTEDQLKKKFNDEFWGTITKQFELREVTITVDPLKDVHSMLNSFFRADSEGFLNEIWMAGLNSVTENFLTENNLIEFYSLDFIKRVDNFFTESTTKDILKQHSEFLRYQMQVAA